jgi:hypothetical protein
MGSTTNGPVLGVKGDGYLQLTFADTTCSSNLSSYVIGGILFNDFDQGLVVAGFTFECDLRIGNGQADPADGFSINYARNDDPVIKALDAGDTFPQMNNAISPNGGQFSDNGNSGDVSLAEEGTTTGLGIGFDLWDSGDYTIPPNPPAVGTVANGLTHDNIGLDIRVDDTLVDTYLMPNGTTGAGGPGADASTATDPQAIETGPFDGTGCATNLSWVHFKAVMDTNGVLNVYWKNTHIITDLHTTFFPSPGRLLMASRVGGNTANIDVDNIQLTTIPATKALIGGTSGGPLGFTIQVGDSGQSVADTNTIQLALNGTDVTPTSITKSGATTTIGYTFPLGSQPLAAGSTNSVTLNIKDTQGNDIGPATRTFVVPSYLTLPVSQQVSNVDTSKPGFRFRLWELSADQYNWLGYDLENYISRAEEELAGLRGPNDADTNGVLGPAVFSDNGYYDESGVINYSELTASGTPNNIGDFQSSGGYPDVMLPGLNLNTQAADPTTQAVNADNTAAEILTYLYFPEPGLYSIVFNSDDGFRMTTSPNPQEVLNSTIVCQADYGKGSSDVSGTIFVPAKGYYGFRTVWFNGGGGCNMEWSGHELAPNPGKLLLLNDPNSPIKAYRDVTSPGPAAVSFIDPTRNTGGPWRPDVKIQAQVVDGASPVSGIQMTLNGQSVTPKTTKSGNVTTVTYQPPTPLVSGSDNQVVLSFTDGSQSYVGTNTFTAAGVAEIPPSLALSSSAVDTSKPGFLVKTVQTDYGLDNTVWRANYQLAGLLGWPNTADQSVFTGPQGYMAETGPINYPGNDALTAPDDFPGSATNAFPGIPGSASAESGVDNFAVEALTVLNLQPGYYLMGVNSDDGCQVTFGNPKEATDLPLGSLNANTAYDAPVGFLTANYGRGQIDNATAAQYFHVTQAGLYPARLLMFQGGGGYICQWYTMISTNAASTANASYDALSVASSRHLINDSSDSSSIVAYQYPLSSAGSPYISGYGPAPTGSGNHTAANAPIWANMVQAAGTLPATGDVSLTVDGAAVTPTVTSNSGVLSVKYTPTTDWSVGQHAVSLVLGDRTVDWTFTVPTNPMPSVPTFDIEAEDYDTGGGQSQAAADQMPYAGGAYKGLDAVLGVDYQRADQASGEIYRSPSMAVHTPAFINADFSRGDGANPYNFRLGYIDPGQWYNYTRTFPDGTYNVYAGISSGNAAGSAHGEYAQLQMVTAGQGTTNQTVQTLGTFDAPATGTWGLNTLVPLKDANGNLASVALSGKQTLRYNLPLSETNVVGSVTNVTPAGAGDWDFMVFVPATAQGPTITGVQLSGTNLIITWTGGGTLQSATSVIGPWSDVAGASSPYSADTTAASMTFYRIRQ